jgi:DNA-binding LacI/PurR family transcriptional regulator
MSTASAAFEPKLMQDVARDVLVRHLGALPIGHRLPPIKDLARQLGVGQSNLHEAMRELARQGLVYSRPKLGTFVAQPVAGGLPSGGSASALASPAPPLAGRSIQIITPGVTDQALVHIIDSAQQELRARGARISNTVHALTSDTVDLDSSSDLMLVVNPSARMVNMRSNRPMVIASTSWHDLTRDRILCDLVGVDQFSGARLAGELLRMTGATQACFVGRRLSHGGAFDAVSELRLAGMQGGWGQALPPEHLLDAEGYSMQAGARGFRRWSELSSRPTAVFAVSDEVAVGFQTAAMGQGLIPGRDFHLVGFDGLYLGQNQPEPLTTVQVPFKAMGRTAAELATQRLLDPQRPVQVTYLGCRLVQGATAWSAGSGPWSSVIS